MLGISRSRFPHTLAKVVAPLEDLQLEIVRGGPTDDAFVIKQAARRPFAWHQLPVPGARDSPHLSYVTALNAFLVLRSVPVLLPRDRK